MLDVFLARLKQKHRTNRYPAVPPPLLDRFRGRPILDFSRCPTDCNLCLQQCPTQAILKTNSALRCDLGRCLFCADCVCPHGSIRFGNEFRLATRTREALFDQGSDYALAEALQGKIKSIYGRSFKMRQVSAGGCNACEADCNVLGTIGWDLSRFGIQFVASPRHADGLLISGPVSQNMRLALEKTYAAVPEPKIVIAVGACAISGGPFRDHSETCNGVSNVFKVDLFIPGCPPHPLTILDGLLRLLGRVQ